MLRCPLAGHKGVARLVRAARSSMADTDSDSSDSHSDSDTAIQPLSLGCAAATAAHSCLAAQSSNGEHVD